MAGACVIVIYSDVVTVDTGDSCLQFFGLDADDLVEEGLFLMEALVTTDLTLEDGIMLVVLCY